MLDSKNRASNTKREIVEIQTRLLNFAELLKSSDIENDFLKREIYQRTCQNIIRTYEFLDQTDDAEQWKSQLLPASADLNIALKSLEHAKDD